MFSVWVLCLMTGIQFHFHFHNHHQFITLSASLVRSLLPKVPPPTTRQFIVPVSSCRFRSPTTHQFITPACSCRFSPPTTRQFITPACSCRFPPPTNRQFITSACSCRFPLPPPISLLPQPAAVCIHSTQALA